MNTAAESGDTLERPDSCLRDGWMDRNWKERVAADRL